MYKWDWSDISTKKTQKIFRQSTPDDNTLVNQISAHKQLIFSAQWTKFLPSADSSCFLPSRLNDCPTIVIYTFRPVDQFSA